MPSRERRRKPPEILLQEALERESALRAERDRLLKRQEIVTELFAGREDAVARVAKLSPRQRQIMALILIGQHNKQIAFETGLSQRTVESHRALIMQKTGANCLPELARLALAAGLLKEEPRSHSGFSNVVLKYRANG